MICRLHVNCVRKSVSLSLSLSLFLSLSLSLFLFLSLAFLPRPLFLGGKSVVSTFFREIHGKYPSQLAEVVSGLPQDLQETLTVAIHGVPLDPALNSNVAPPSITTTITTTSAPGIETNSSNNNNNDGDLSPSDNGEQVEAA